ncbi:hypothetical protein HOLDEFILI_01213 [Holdemania filiformis DSM 12042]|uniref:Uncharacterized protein n=1 Tax=Holdemania filiformis DSM 12042 TaxID=545696 RepID=B9Y5Y1_9FIRM|nr:hypothetical protein HOLDEFILI_01213 [Holdemania filiformis DSM 12042]
MTKDREFLPGKTTAFGSFHRRQNRMDPSSTSHDFTFRFRLCENNTLLKFVFSSRVSAIMKLRKG